MYLSFRAFQYPWLISMIETLQCGRMELHNLAFCYPCAVGWCRGSCVEAGRPTVRLLNQIAEERNKISWHEDLHSLSTDTDSEILHFIFSSSAKVYNQILLWHELPVLL